MALKNSFLMILNLISLNSFSAPTKLPELATKQDITKIRFISKDGKITYYQKSNGNLAISTNYAVRDVIKNDKLTNYQLMLGPAGKKLAVVVDQNYFTKNSLRRPSEIGVLDLAGSEYTYLGLGIAPKLHFDDSWMTFFNPQTKTIHFHSLINQGVKFEIDLKNAINPYFIPQIIMISETVVIYTDLNDKGHTELFQYDRKAKKFKMLKRTKQAGIKVELCQSSDFLYLAFLPYKDVLSGSRIEQVPTGVNFNYPERPKIIYQSEGKDIGNLKCLTNKDHLYFVQDQKSPDNQYVTEVVSLDLTSKKIQVLSDVGHASQFIDMDGQLILPYYGKMYLLKGLNKAANDSLDKAGPKQK